MRVVEQYLPPYICESWIKGPLVLFVVPIVLVSMWMFGLYRPRRDRSLWPEQADILKMSPAAIAALIVGLWALEHSAFTGHVGPSGAPVQTIMLWGRQVDGGKVQLGLLAAALPAF